MQWGMEILVPFAPAPRQLRYLIVSVDYFTKWIEVEALANITATNIINLFKKNMLARFGVLQAIIIDNGTRFIEKRLKSLMEELRIKHFASVEHPQTNSHPEATNRVITRGLKQRLEEAKGNWDDELPHVLWA